MMATAGSVITWIILGILVGAIAKWIMPGRQGGGIIATTILGIIGGLVGGFIGRSLIGWDVVGLDWRSILMAILGSVLVLFAWLKITDKK